MVTDAEAEDKDLLLSPQLDWWIVLTSQSQGEGWGLDILWRDWSAGVCSSMLLVKAVDDHPLLIGAEVQSIPVCRVSYHFYGLRDSIPFEYKSQYMLRTALWVNTTTATCTVNAPVQCKAPSRSSTSSGLTTYKHSLPKAEHVGRSCWMYLHLEVWTHRTLAHTQKYWLHESTAELNTRLSYLRCYSGFSSYESTCYIKFDGVRGGPPAQWLVRLKPEVVLACITQLHNPNLDRTAGIAPSNVAGAIQQQATINFSDISVQYATLKKITVFSPTVCVHGMTGWSRWGQCGEWTPCGRLQTHGTTWPASLCDLWTPARTPTLIDLNLVAGKFIL